MYILLNVVQTEKYTQATYRLLYHIIHVTCNILLTAQL
jgi:hypothetical protein